MRVAMCARIYPQRGTKHRILSKKRFTYAGSPEHIICAGKCVAAAAISQVQGVTDPVDFDRMGGMSNLAPATKYLATTDNNISRSKLIYQIDLVCSLADHTKNTQNSTVSILNMLYILLAANPNTYPWTANTSKTCRSCMSPGIICTAGIDIKTSSAI